jgi:type VI secretion system protein ImpC
MNDFEPVKIIEQVPSLRHLLELRQQLVEGKRQVDGESRSIADIDSLLSRQLSRIMQAPEFQSLEASWRGLHYLVSRTETGPLLKIRVLNVSKQELLRDLERAPEFDLSALFKKVYDEVYGTLDGIPFGALIGDYEFGPCPQDMSLLEQIAHIAAKAQTPFIAAAHPCLFNLDSFTELGVPRDLANIFDAESNPKCIKWESFRQSEDSRYVGLVLPHMLLRLPYDLETVPVAAFHFKEDAEGKDHRKYLWGNAAYAFGARLTEAFAKHGWCAAILGVEGGLVQGLPAHTCKTDDGTVAFKCPTDIAITERREMELAQLGFIPLVHRKGTDSAVFFSAPSCQRPRKYDSDSDVVNAYLLTRLQYTLTMSRFAQYLMVIMRNEADSFMTCGDCERLLNQWLSHYVTMSDDVSLASQAQFPLREAKVRISTVKGKPGHFQVMMFLHPRFQLAAPGLTGLTVYFRLAALGRPV